MAANPLSGFEGYGSRTVTCKNEGNIELKLDILFPEAKSSTPVPVLLHYHGGFLVVGDRYSFLPYWLINACISRKWIFVTPDYRLLPETTAHSSVDDAVDAYKWVLSSLSSEIGVSLGPVLMAGSSAGGYLALTTACLTLPRPHALLLIYGMLDASNERYTTPGTNIWGKPPFDTKPVLSQFPQPGESGKSGILTGYSMPRQPDDARVQLLSIFHIDAFFPDYMTGTPGLSKSMAKDGPSAVPAAHRRLFALAFDTPSDLPPTILIHGKNDSAVPFVLSDVASKKLQSLGVHVQEEFPEDAEHGFDGRLGNVDLENRDDLTEANVQSLRNAITFLDKIVAGTSSPAL